MKVAVVIDTWFPAIGGGQINALEISKRIANKGIEIDIITRNNGVYKADKINNLNIHRLGLQSEALDNVSRILFLIKAFLFIKKNNYDVVHLQAFLPGLLAPFIHLLLKKPVIFTVHGTRMFEKTPKKTFGYILEKFILTKIKYDAQISVTRAFMKFQNINTNTFYIPNGIDVQKFKKINVQKAKDPKILWVGRFDPVKRIEDLVTAMKTVNAKVPKAKLTLVGYGQEEQKIKNLVKKLNVKNVEFTGKKEGIDLIREYKSSYVFVLPSASEGQPLTILEAKAANLPIIASNIGGIPELLDKSIDCLIPPKKPELLANTILKTLNSSNHTGSGILSKKYDWLIVSNKTLDVYNKVI